MNLFLNGNGFFNTGPEGPDLEGEQAQAANKHKETYTSYNVCKLAKFRAKFISHQFPGFLNGLPVIVQKCYAMVCMVYDKARPTKSGKSKGPTEN